MYSNKSEENIKNWSSANPGINDIALQFDKTAATVVRCKKHKNKNNCSIIEKVRLRAMLQFTPNYLAENKGL